MMKTKVIEDAIVPGFPDAKGYIEIMYHIPSGTQGVSRFSITVSQQLYNGSFLLLARTSSSGREVFRHVSYRLLAQ